MRFGFASELISVTLRAHPLASDGFPYFPLYASDFLSDPNVAAMGPQELGCYFRLLCYQWTAGGDGISADPVVLARLCNCSPEAFAAAWAVVGVCFVPHPKRAGFLLNPRLHGEYLEAVEKRARRVTAGLQGGRGRKAGPRADKPARAVPLVKVAFDGQRVRVWTWQHEEFVKILGAKPFDLLGWYPKLDAELVKSGDAMPEPDKYLRERFYQAAGIQRPNLFGRQAAPVVGAPCIGRHSPPCANDDECYKLLRRERAS